MANINIEIDTEKYAIKASVDGKNIPDIQSISVYKYTPYDAREDDEKKIRVEVVSGTTDEESGVSRTLITCVAGEHIEVKDKLTDDLIKVLFPK
jgi:hypothetical protein